MVDLRSKISHKIVLVTLQLNINVQTSFNPPKNASFSLPHYVPDLYSCRNKTLIIINDIVSCDPISRHAVHTSSAQCQTEQRQLSACVCSIFACSHYMVDCAIISLI